MKKTTNDSWIKEFNEMFVLHKSDCFIKGDGVCDCEVYDSEITINEELEMKLKSFISSLIRQKQKEAIELALVSIGSDIEPDKYGLRDAENFVNTERERIRQQIINDAMERRGIDLFPKEQIKNMKTPQQVLQDAREEFERKFCKYAKSNAPRWIFGRPFLESVDADDVKFFITSTLQAFLEAEITLLMEKKFVIDEEYDGNRKLVKIEPNFSVNQFIDAQILHFKELLVILSQ